MNYKIKYDLDGISLWFNDKFVHYGTTTAELEFWNKIQELKDLLKECDESEIHTFACALNKDNSDCTCLLGKIRKAIDF
jgi:hypothetical protein